MLARANIRKTKGQTATLAALLLISSMMLSLGLNVLLGFGSFFDKTSEELNTSDAVILIPEPLYNEEAERYLSENTEQFQIYKGLLGPTKVIWKDAEREVYEIICDINEPRDFTKVKLVGDSLPETPGAIYLTYRYKVVGGYDLGDSITISFMGEPYHFTVAGFVENIYNDNMHIGEAIYLPSERYNELAEDLPEYRKQIVCANGISSIGKIEYTLLSITGAATRGYGGDFTNVLVAADLSTIKTIRTSMASMISVMLIVVTIVIVIVCLLVIRFRIGNSIEEDMPKIGSLQSVGYTCRQISLSMITQYGVIALAACVIGVFPAYLLLPVVSDVFAIQSGMLWKPSFEVGLNLITVGAMTFVVLAVSLLAARKTRKITPVQALRGGITTHNFKRNHIPLEKSRLPLTAALSVKSVLQGAKQSIMMGVIIAAVSFTSVIAVVLYYNAAVDLSTFEKVPGIERANAAIAFMQEEDMQALRREVAAHKNVRGAQFLDMGKTVIDAAEASIVTMDDYSQRETNNVYEGVFPRYDNEIAVSALLAELLGKGVGDEVSVGLDEKPYLITGLTQGTEAGLYMAYLTVEGTRRIDPRFQQQALMIYLNKGTDAALFTEEMEEVYAGRIHMVVDGDASFAEGVSSFASIVSLIGLAIVIVAGFVVILVLYFVIGSTIIRRRRELGIQKAIGYTTANLMNQITLGFTLPIIIGAVSGCVLGALLTNPFMSVGMAQMGVMKADYIINSTWITATCVCMIVLSYLTSMLITARIRKISAYTLVTE